MRLSLVLHRKASHRDGRGRSRGHIGMGPAGVQRDQAVAAAETVALVLGEDSPLPESASDVEELALRLHGHISQLGFVAPPESSALLGAQQLGSAGVPAGYMPSRVHLVKLAEATQALLAAVQAHGPTPVRQPQRGRWWKPRINVLRGSVFAVAFACLVLAASVPRA
ncbi:DUF6415 family natural product biosynthesis protein [Streptomyces niveus]|uniref:DUF6415 family natural product biosynthesis protein n=1 Tax=Streptomyces niveus TaxID=193462 RepID=UPI0020D26D69|nr:DUF6415 family natural product biosynthesis protein [Streptomyces niveus]